MISVRRNQDQDQNPHMFQHSYVKMFKLHVFYFPLAVLYECMTPQAQNSKTSLTGWAFKLFCQTLMTQGNEESEQNTRRFVWYPKMNQKTLLALNICWGKCKMHSDHYVFL